jgi:D-alanyl-D-alanine carboxypeptidase (penicillin-binding protein 5/6)
LKACFSLLAAALVWLTGTSATPAVPPANPALNETGIASPPSPADAPIALLVDLSSGQTLFSRDPDRRFVPASITKVMTVFVAFEMIDSGKIDPGQTVMMSTDAYKHWHAVGSTMFLKEHQRVTVDQLLHGITTVSANDGSVVLAEGLAGSTEKWVAMMNAAARRIGMEDSHYGRPNGWMDDGQTFVTAHDLVTLATALIQRHPDLYRRYFGHKRLRFNGFEQVNHDPITGVVPGADGIKTGFTNQAGYGFLGSAERDGRRLIMVVAGSPTGRARNEAARSLMEWGFEAFGSQPLFPKGSVVGEAAVQDGDSRHVALIAPQAISAAMPQGTHPQVKLSIRYEGPLRAPIRAGKPVAELVIEAAGMPTSRVPLTARDDVAQANLFYRLTNGIAGIL